MPGPWTCRIVRPEAVATALAAAGIVPAGASVYECLDAFQERLADCLGALGHVPCIAVGRGASPQAPRDAELDVFFVCPQCGEAASCHLVHQPVRESDDRWEWNGDWTAPTLWPSLHRPAERGGCGGHYWLRAGTLTDYGGHR